MAFGFLKTKPVEVRPGDMPKPSDMSFSNKLLMASFVLQDRPELAMQIPMMAAAQQRQAQQAGLMREFGQAFDGGPLELMPKPKREEPLPEVAPSDPVAEATARLQASGGLEDIPTIGRSKVDTSVPDIPMLAPAKNGPVSRRSLAPLLSRMAMAGIDVKPFVDIAEGAEPQIEYINNVRVDKRDPNAPAEIFEVDKGQRRVYDADGRPIGVMNAQGYVQSVAELESARTGASEAAKAAFDVIEIPLANGQKVTLPRLEAIQRLAGQGGGASAPGGFGVTPSKADEAADVDTAKAQVELDFMRPKAQSALEAMEAKNAVVDDAIERALGLIGAGTAGFGSMLARIPGTPARDLQSSLETIKANLGFDELQTMRENSPTGGALGAVAVQELEALRSTLSSLDQAQSPEALKESLERIKEIRAGSLERRRNAFSRTFEQKRERPTGPATGGSTPKQRSGGLSSVPLADRLAEARRRGLIQ